MCPNRFSFTFQLIKSLLPEAERASPGHGCQLLTAVSSVGDMALVAGIATGLALAWVLYDLASSVRGSRRYREWKAARDGN